MNKFTDNIVIIAAVICFQIIFLAVKVNAEISRIVEDKANSRKLTGAFNSRAEIAPRLRIVALSLSTRVWIYGYFAYVIRAVGLRVGDSFPAYPVFQMLYFFGYVFIHFPLPPDFRMADRCR